jgi:hypothetical protein
MAHRFTSSTRQLNANIGIENSMSLYLLFIRLNKPLFFLTDPLLNNHRSVLSYRVKETHVSIVDPIQDNKQHVGLSVFFLLLEYLFIYLEGN